MIPWSHEGVTVKDHPADAKAFVYLLEFADGSKYLGKKNLQSTRRKKVPGKVRRVVTTTESDWKKYLSSSTEVKAKIKAGDKLVKREVLQWCDTVGGASYWEAYWQFMEHVLLSTEWLNRWISVRIYKQKLKEDTE